LATTIHNASVVKSTLQSVDLGTVRLLPPTLALQYHFLPDDVISPYVGAGINYTFFYDASSGVGNSAFALRDIDYSSGFGYAFQIGVDYKIDDTWHLNADLKKIFLNTDINVNNGVVKVDDADVDPWILGIGLGYRF
jgi:outer membrane protein